VKYGPLSHCCSRIILSLTGSYVWPKVLHSLCVPDEPGEESRRKSENLRFNAITEKGDGPNHEHSIAYTLC